MTSDTKQRWVLLGMALAWSTATCLFLSIVLYGAINQWRAGAFATTRGVVESIRETVSHSGGRHHSTTYGIDIRYHYEVNGQGYEGDRIRFAAGSSSVAWAREMLQRFKVHSRPTVYYNPVSPREAVLIAGVEGEDLFLLLFLTPFVVVMVIMWVGVFRTLRGYRSTGAFGVKERGTELRVRPSAMVPVWAGLGTLGGGAFASMFVIAPLLGGLHPSMRTMEIAWAIVGGLAAGVFWVTLMLRAMGRWDIVFDDARRVVRKGSLRIAYRDIQGVQVEDAMKTKGKDNVFQVGLDYRENEKPLRLVVCGWLPSDEVARRLAGYLAVHVGKPVHDGVMVVSAAPVASGREVGVGG